MEKEISIFDEQEDESLVENEAELVDEQESQPVKIDKSNKFKNIFKKD